MLRATVTGNVWSTRRLAEIPAGAFLEVEVDGGARMVAFDVLGTGIGEQVEQFLLDVAIVDVERRHPGPMGADHRLQVLVTVAQVQPDVVLAGLVPGELVALGVAAEALRHQIARDPVDPGVHLRVGEPTVPPDHHLLVGDGLSGGAKDGGEVEADGAAHVDSLPKASAEPTPPSGPRGRMAMLKGDHVPDDRRGAWRG